MPTPTKESFKEMFERYCSIVWHALGVAARGLKEFLLSFFDLLFGSAEKIGQGLAFIFRALGVFFFSLATLGLVFGTGFYLFAQAFALSDSPSFQALREKVLEGHMMRVQHRMDDPNFYKNHRCERYDEKVKSDTTLTPQQSAE